jgi:PAS domain S-box-containing protein
VDHRRPHPALTEERYRRLVERSPDGICVHRDGRILYVNDAGVRLMLADSPEAITGRRITDFVSPESIPPMQAGVAALREVGDCSPHYPAQMIRTDGTLLAVEIVIVLTMWDDEFAHQVITRDVSSRHATDVALRYQAALVNHVSDASSGRRERA